MAKQKGIIKLDGTIGDITFYKSKDGYLAREKGGVPGDRIATDPAFARTRENGAEFGRAGKAGKVLRNALRNLLQNASDGRVVSRLTTEMLKVVQADLTSERGLRNVLDGEVDLLLGFDFNLNAKLGTTLYIPFTTAIDRVAGSLTAIIPDHIPLNTLSAPGGATHYKINSAGVEIDFETETFVFDSQATGIQPIDAEGKAGVNLVNTVTAASTKPLFLALGVEFFQQVNGNFYSLRNGAFNALSLVAVDGGV